MSTMMSVKEAATHASVSESLVYAWCADGTLPHSRMGRKGKRGTIRITVEDLNGVIAALKVGPNNAPRAGRVPC